MGKWAVVGVDLENTHIHTKKYHPSGVGNFFGRKRSFHVVSPGRLVES